MLQFWLNFGQEVKWDSAWHCQGIWLSISLQSNFNWIIVKQAYVSEHDCVDAINSLDQTLLTKDALI